METEPPAQEPWKMLQGPDVPGPWVEQQAKAAQKPHRVVHQPQERTLKQEQVERDPLGTVRNLGRYLKHGQVRNVEQGQVNRYRQVVKITPRWVQNHRYWSCGTHGEQSWCVQGSSRCYPFKDPQDPWDSVPHGSDPH